MDDDDDDNNNNNYNVTMIIFITFNDTSESIVTRQQCILTNRGRRARFAKFK